MTAVSPQNRDNHSDCNNHDSKYRSTGCMIEHHNSTTLTDDKPVVTQSDRIILRLSILLNISGLSGPSKSGLLLSAAH